MPVRAILFDFVGVLLQKRADCAPDALTDEMDRYGSEQDHVGGRKMA
jgi:hypothetical protein